MTKNEQVLAARTIVAQIGELQKVEAVTWVDWDGCDTLELRFYPVKQKGGLIQGVWTGEFQYSLRGLMHQVHGILRRHNAVLLEKESPVRVYREGPHRKMLDHYDRDNYELTVQIK